MNRFGAEAVVIGASAGGIDALSQILPSLPPGFPLAVMVVIHLPPDKTSVMHSLFAAKCQVPVREAEDKEPIRPGTVYFAPPDYHLLVETDKHLSLSSEEPANYSRPSIDVLFETAADTYGRSLIGIILTGASSDGAQGLRSVLEAGGTALVEHPDQAYASTMPRTALQICPTARSMSLGDIAEYLLSIKTSA
jgi:two-component system, chemotaxis family, protein-glutamate methylesterase/glutaminase